MNESNKLLHERLRDFDGRGDFVCENEETIGLWGNEADILADEIERYYIPRPRFEDGEPIKIGDEVENGIVRFIDVSNDGSWSVYNEKAEELYIGNAGELMKRPAPKLDADGVPIKVGDTVYSLLNDGDEAYGTCYTVADILYGGACLIECGHGSKDVWVFHPQDLTHREPDTQEKIDADKQKYVKSYWKCSKHLCAECPSLIEGKPPEDYYDVYNCVVAQGLDIARRQAELDARMRKE